MMMINDRVQFKGVKLNLEFNSNNDIVIFDAPILPKKTPRKSFRWWSRWKSPCTFCSDGIQITFELVYSKFDAKYDAYYTLCVRQMCYTYAYTIRMYILSLVCLLYLM